MSHFLEKIRDAEQRRLRVVAERRRLEAEADAALASREREEQRRTHDDPPQAAPAPPATPASARYFPWGWATVALAFLAGSVFLMPEKEKAPAAEARPEAMRSFGLKLDRDVEAFSARVREWERQ